MQKLREFLSASSEGFSILNFLTLTFAGIVNSIGVTMFLAPVNLYDSGLSGTSMLLWQITPSYMTLSLFLLVLNIPLFLYGYKKQGLVFTVYSVYAVAIYALSSHIITNVLPVDVSVSSPFAGSDLLLCSIFGGIISGVGSGLTIRFGGAIDGMEILAVIFAKKIGISVGTFIMIYNVILYMITGIILKSWILPLYSVITYCAALKTIDFIVEGLDKAKSAMIITTKQEKISSALSQEFGSGITIIDARGFYSNEEKTIIYFVMNRFQIGKMRRIVYKYDKGAFISISEVSDVFARNRSK